MEGHLPSAKLDMNSDTVSKRSIHKIFVIQISLGVKQLIFSKTQVLDPFKDLQEVVLLLLRTTLNLSSSFHFPLLHDLQLSRTNLRPL